MGKGNKGKKNKEGCEPGALSGLPQRDPWEHALASISFSLSQFSSGEFGIGMDHAAGQL